MWPNLQEITEKILNGKLHFLYSANLTPFIDGPRVATLKTHLYLKFSLKATQIESFSSIHCLRKL